MARKLTPKQKKFADKYLENGNATQAAVESYNVKSRDVARKVGSENLTKPDIEAYLQNKLEMAKNIIEDLAQNADSDVVRLQAAKDIADRIEGKPVQRQINANTDTNKEYRWAE